MRRTIIIATAAIALAGTGGFVLAQGQPLHGGHHGQGHGQGHGQFQGQGGGMPMMQGRGAHDHAQAPAEATPSTRAFLAASEKMHRDMAITYSGDADRDFAAGMIPHHLGAIDMARIVLEHGSDPEVRALAQSIIRDQEREVAQMQAILRRLPAR